MRQLAILVGLVALVETLVFGVRYVPPDAAAGVANYVAPAAVVVLLFVFAVALWKFFAWYLKFNRRMQTSGLWGRQT